MKYITFVAFWSVVVWSCYSEDDYEPRAILTSISISVDNDNALADGLDRIEVSVNIAGELESIDSDSVFFKVRRSNQNENLLSPMTTVLLDDKIQKKATIILSSGLAEEIGIDAGIIYGGVAISKSTSIQFQLAFPEAIEISTDNSIVMADSSFSEIMLQAKVSRKEGNVTVGSLVSIEVIDTVGVSRGILSREKGDAGMEELFSTSFSMGLDNYSGPLNVIANALSGTGDVLVTDTLLILSK